MNFRIIKYNIHPVFLILIREIVILLVYLRSMDDYKTNYTRSLPNDYWHDYVVGTRINIIVILSAILSQRYIFLNIIKVKPQY